MKTLTIAVILAMLTTGAAFAADIGSEKAVARHLADGEEFQLSSRELIRHGKLLFNAMWTVEDGGGRPLTKGTGAPLADLSSPLVFPRNFNRVSAPDSNACSGCHNLPRSGGAGDQVANVFVLGQRFDFATFDLLDPSPTRGSAGENGVPATLQSIANERNTVGMFGSGYIEMLSRQMTAQLQAQRDALAPGDSTMLSAKDIEFGMLARNADGSWDTSGISALTPMSLASSAADDPPSLVIRPFHQASAVVSLREFSNNAFNHHHGIQTTERFGTDTDPDGDGHANEMTRADVTAVSLYQAALAVPGRVIPRNGDIEKAVRVGERTFASIGCTDCHVASLQLDKKAWFYSEPNPYNPPGNLAVGEAPDLAINLASRNLPLPRLEVWRNAVSVPAFTDFRLHNITSGSDDPNCEALNMHESPVNSAFFEGNCRFLTARLWGVASSAPYFHHGKFTTMRQAIEAHAGEAQHAADGWAGLSEYERDGVIEFLKTLQVLPEGTRSRIVDERFHPRRWVGWIHYRESE